MKTKEEKKKSNLGFMLLVILLISVFLCISSFGIATWARYRSITGGNVEAQIAKWSFKVNGEEEQFADINLADTIDFTNVTIDKVAPGTYGSFDLEIDASGSEVSLDYYIDIDVTEKPTNLAFYSDSLFQNKLNIVNNKIEFEDEILLPNINTPVTKTIYWKWDYRTENLPSEEILQGYYSSIDGLEVLVNEYNNATAQQQQEIVLKINDKIDTYEQGEEVILPVIIKGIQKYTGEFSAKGIHITSSTSNEYMKNDEVTFSLEFTESIFADTNQTQITSSNAPVVMIDFEEITTANNPVAKVASLMNTQITLAEGSGKQATFVSAERNKINYKYVIQKGEVGKLKIVEISGSVFNKSGDEIQFDNTSIVEIKGENIDVKAALELQVGSRVYYTPPTATYTYDRANLQSSKGTESDYAQTGTDTLHNTSDCKITEWNVFEIGEDGNVKLIPVKSTTGGIYLMGANGYNNGVKIINEACSILFSNSEKNITARSICYEDIKRVMHGNEDKNYHQYFDSAVTRKYPKRYAEEYKSIIKGVERSNGLNISDSGTGILTGYSSASIKPYEYPSEIWFKNVDEKYKDLLSNRGNYWVASRCAEYNSENATNFGIMKKGTINSDKVYDAIVRGGLFDSYDTWSFKKWGALFPVVELNASQLQENEEETGWEVK